MTYKELGATTYLNKGTSENELTAIIDGEEVSLQREEPFSKNIEKIGWCEIESVPLECEICGRVIKHMPNVVHSYIKQVHGLDWLRYMLLLLVSLSLRLANLNSISIKVGPDRLCFKNKSRLNSAKIVLHSDKFKSGKTWPS